MPRWRRADKRSARVETPAMGNGCHTEMGNKINASKDAPQTHSPVFPEKQATAEWPAQNERRNTITLVSTWGAGASPWLLWFSWIAVGKRPPLAGSEQRERPPLRQKPEEPGGTTPQRSEPLAPQVVSDKEVANTPLAAPRWDVPDPFRTRRRTDFRTKNALMLPLHS